MTPSTPYWMTETTGKEYGNLSPSDGLPIVVRRSQERAPQRTFQRREPGILATSSTTGVFLNAVSNDTLLKRGGCSRAVPVRVCDIASYFVADSRGASPLLPKGPRRS